MVDVAKVKMFGMNVGSFRWDYAYNVARFEYDAQFVGKGIEPAARAERTDEQGEKTEEYAEVQTRKRKDMACTRLRKHVAHL